MNDDHFTALVTRHLDRALDAAGRRELAEVLRNDPARRRDYLRLLEQDELLVTGVRESLTPSARIDAARLPRTRRTRRRARIRAWTGWSAWIAAALILVVAGYVVLRPDEGVPFRAIADGALVVERAGAVLPPSTTLRHGDVLSASGDGSVRFPDGGMVALRPSAQVRLQADASSPQGVHLDLRNGVIACDLPHQPRGFTVRTAHTRVAVVGTRFRVEVDPDASEVQVDDGRVRVATTTGEALLSAGEHARVSASGITRSAADSPARLDDPTRWQTSGTLTTQSHRGGAQVQSPPPTQPRNGFLWRGRAWRWHAPLPSSAAIAVQARFALPPADDGIWHGEVFLAPPDAHQDVDEAQPSPCLRLAVRTGIPTVVRRTTPDAEPEVLWTGETVPAGPRLLRLELRDSQVIAAIDGREVWRGPLPYPVIVPGLRWTRRAPGAAPMVIDQVALESLLPE